MNGKRTHRAGLAILAAAMVALAAGCTGTGWKTDYELDQERISSYLAAHPKLDEATATAIRQGEVRKGMTMEQVVAAWGRPAVVQRFRGGAQQLWFFGCSWRHMCSDSDEWFPTPNEIYSSQVLFENGRVVHHTG